MSLQCSVTRLCSNCDGKHHTLLHIGTMVSNTVNEVTSGQGSSSPVASLTSTLVQRNVMLGTALVHIRDHSGSMQTVRALVDGSSQNTTLTSRCVERLGLKVKRWTASVTGLAGVQVPSVIGQVQCLMTTRYSESLRLPMTAWVLDNITNQMPTRPMPIIVKEHYAHLTMADPDFDKPSPVDLLMGVDLYPLVMENGKIVIDKDLPAAFNTIFWWIIIGLIPSPLYIEFQKELVSFTVP